MIPSSSSCAPRCPLVRDGDAFSLAATLDGAGALAELGVTDVNLTFTVFVRDEAGVKPWFDELASRWGSAT